MSDNGYKQIVILSGKGGTGKTTISAAFASFENNKVVVDCDVDAANMHLILNPKSEKSYEFSGGKKAAINNEKCTQCGLCETVCRFDAISDFAIDQLKCEGCGFCFRVCPENAISFSPLIGGNYFECELEDDSKFFFAKLFPGEGNSGKLVSEIKKSALNSFKDSNEYSTERFVIVDGPPGIGCPVNASISKADFAVLVTEPTLSGVHDLKRLVELLNTFKINMGIIINKSDLNESVAEQIKDHADEKEIPLLGEIPFNQTFVKALIKGKNIIDLDESVKIDLLNIWEKTKLYIKN
ncbi:MAG: ATP-binding protein [Melioribacteraceae bacterium]